MRPELKRLIMNARARLGGCALSADDAEENARRKALEHFGALLVGKIPIATGMEILLGVEFIWLDTRPAARFGIDGHTFAILGGPGEWELVEESGSGLTPLASLAVSDPQFEDRLLAAIGTVLDPVIQ